MVLVSESERELDPFTKLPGEGQDLVTLDPPWQCWCLPVVQIQKKKEPYQLQSHQIDFLLALPTWLNLSDGETQEVHDPP